MIMTISGISRNSVRLIMSRNLIFYRETLIKMILLIALVTKLFMKMHMDLSRRN